MIDYHTTLVAALKEILPTHYEMTLHSGLKTPCISYIERNNYTTDTGDTLGYTASEEKGLVFHYHRCMRVFGQTR